MARQLHRAGVPVVYLVAPQAWAWRRGRVRQMRRTLERVLCIFPFEEEFFRREGVRATYIGHPLAGLVRASLTREAFFRKHGLVRHRPLIAVLPGSRRGEAARHMAPLLDAVERMERIRPANWVLPASPIAGAGFFRDRTRGSAIRVIEGESWDAMAHAELALAASGTVTVEAALLGTPMVTYYKVTTPSWLAGKLLVDVPFYSMVNLIAGRAVVPELMQSRMTGENIAAEARAPLTDPARASGNAGRPGRSSRPAVRGNRRPPAGRGHHSRHSGRTSCSCIVFSHPRRRAVGGGPLLFAAAPGAPAQERRSRIEVAAGRHRSGNLPGRARLSAKATFVHAAGRWRQHRAIFELNNALNVSAW